MKNLMDDFNKNALYNLFHDCGIVVQLNNIYILERIMTQMEIQIKWRHYKNGS
jgi:hypothetical protein